MWILPLSGAYLARSIGVFLYDDVVEAFENKQMLL